MNVKSICVFCGAQDAVPAEHLDIGSQLGKDLALNDKRLVYGGGDCGVMGRIANATMDNGGEVTGVFPRSLRDIEAEHRGITETIVVDTMHERKQIMYERSEAFIILPGGFGTMDEMFEILTWRQLKLHEKPIIIFNHKGYWNHLVALMDNIVSNGFAREVNRGYYQVVENYDELKSLLNLG